MGFGGATFWSFRKYNYQSKLICIPFLAYAGRSFMFCSNTANIVVAVGRFFNRVCNWTSKDAT